ncbi:MAG: heparinase II/III family protein [bacterium]
MPNAPERDIINGATTIEAELWGVHPRLYFNAGRIAELKKLVVRNPWRRFLAAIRQRADAGNSPDQALVYLLTDERKYYDLAIVAVDQMLVNKGRQLGDRIAGLALIYDWLYHSLDADRRAAILAVLDLDARADYEKLAKFEIYEASTYVWNIAMHLFANCATAGFAIYGDCPNVAPWLRYVGERCRSITAALGPDGVSPEGICYGGFFNEYYLRTIDLVRDLLNMDFYAGNAYLRNMPFIYLYSMLPERHIKSEVHLNYGDAVPWNWFGPDNYLRRVAGIYRNPQAQWAADIQEKAGVCGTGGAFLNLAWYDHTVKPVAPEKLPTLHHFEDKGLVIMRSGWDGDESAFVFRCGPHAGQHALQNYRQCIGGGHMIPDAGSFMLFAHGDWQIRDSGYAHKFTAYRNTVLVNGIGQTGEGGIWFECVNLRREQRGPRILRVESGKAYDLVTGDATAAYEPQAGLKRFWRHVVYLRPDIWVLIDELSAASNSVFDLHFHSFGQEFQADRPFKCDGPQNWINGGDKGRLRVTSLYPADAVGSAEIQAIKGEEGAHHNRDICMLRLRNAKLTKRTTFVTVLETFVATEKPRASFALKKSGATLTLEVTQNGKRQKVVINPFARSAEDAVRIG